MNTITIELCAEDRARLDKIIEALEYSKPRCDTCLSLIHDISKGTGAPEAAPEATDEPNPKQTPAKVEKPAEVKPENAEASPVTIPDDPTPDEDIPVVTSADIQKKVIALASAGKKEEVKAIVNAYAEKVSLIPADKYAEVYAKLEALEG